MPFPIEGSFFNLLTLPDVVITQSGSEVLSSGNLSAIIQDGNTSYETIWGYCIQPSAGLAGYPSGNAGDATVSISLSSNSNVINGSQYVRPVAGSSFSFKPLIGIDFGSTKSVNYVYAGDGGHYCMMNKTPVADADGNVGIYKSSNNTSWSLVDSSYTGGTYWASLSNSRAIPITSTSTRYIGFFGKSVVQPNGTSHVNDRVSSIANSIFAYDTTASGIQDYEMKIDLGDTYDIYAVSIVDNADLHKLRFPYTVKYALEDSVYAYKNRKYTLDHVFHWYEEDPSERSPVAPETRNPNDIYNSAQYNNILYNPNDNCLYLYYALKMYKFDLVAREWSTLSTNTYATSNNEITLDIKSNEIYGLGNTLWKYSIYKDSFTPISFQSSSLSSGTPVTVCYSPYDHSLYCGMSASNVFAKYSIKTDTWSLVTSVTSGKYFLRGSRTVFSSYNNCIYATLSDSSSINNFNFFYKYDVVANTWTNMTTYNGGSGISLYSDSPLRMLEWALDTKRNIIHFYYNSGYGFAHSYSIPNNSWTGYPNTSPFGQPSYMDTGYRDYSGNDARDQLDGFSSFCYVASEDRIYSHAENYNAYIPSNTVDQNWNRHLRYTPSLDRLYSCDYVVMDKARYIKISANSSKVGYPLMIKELKVRPINSYFNSSAGLNLVHTDVYDTGDIVTVNLVNNTHDVVYSGMAYVSDNTDGYFEISDSIDGTYTSGQLNFTFPSGLAPASGYSLFVKHNFPSGVQNSISNVKLNVLLEGYHNV